MRSLRAARTVTAAALTATVVLFVTAGCVGGALSQQRQSRVWQRLSSAQVQWSGRLQRRLDRIGGFVFLPRLGGGACYETRGLWVSRSWTTIASNGACLRVVRPGPVRLRSADGDPIAASAAFFIGRSSKRARPPAHIVIRGIRIVVAPGAIDGIDIYARDVRVSDVTITGSPLDSLYIGGRTHLIDYSRNVSVSGSLLRDAERNAISITAAVGVRLIDNRITGAGFQGGGGQPGDGIDVEPNAATDPIVRLAITGNRIVDSVGAGVALALDRMPVRADQIAIVGNTLVGNDQGRGGCQILLSGGESDGWGRVFVGANRIDGNQGETCATGSTSVLLTPVREPGRSPQIRILHRFEQPLGWR